MEYLEIVFDIEGFGSDADLEKRYALEDFLDHILRTDELGYVNGGSIGSGTMEVGCAVSGFMKAKTLIQKKVQGTEFSNYSQIKMM